MAAVNLGKFSIGHATVNQTCSTLVSTVHISFLRFQLVKEQRNTLGGLSWRSQHSIRDLTSRRLKSFMKKSALSYWSMKRRRTNWETGYCQSPGDIWSWAKRECQPRRVQGQRYLQVRWMHTGLAPFQAPCHLLQLLLTSMVPEWAGTAFLGGKAVRDMSQPSQGSSALSNALWTTLLLPVLQNSPGSGTDCIGLQLKCVRKLQLLQQWQHFIRSSEDTSRVLSHNDMV